MPAIRLAADSDAAANEGLVHGHRRGVGMLAVAPHVNGRAVHVGDQDVILILDPGRREPIDQS